MVFRAFGIFLSVSGQARREQHERRGKKSHGGILYAVRGLRVARGGLAGWYSRRIVFQLSDRRAGPYAGAACAALAAYLSLAPATACAAGAPAAAQDAVARCAAGADTVRCLLDAVPAAALEEALFADALLPARVLPRIAGALMGAPGDARLGEYVVEVARARTRRLSALGSWTDAQGEACLRLQLVDADRFVEDAAFRARVLALLPRAFDRDASPALRDQLLYSINSIPGVDYAASEAVEWGWGAIGRRSLARETPFRAGALDFPDDATHAIAASVYSFPGPYLDPAGVARFMSEMRRLRPGRELIALVDLPMRTAIAAAASGWTLVETHGREFSPWPRDPFSVLRRADGGLTFLTRPNVQRQRGADNEMPLELIQGLPARLDTAWGRPTWTRSPAPFHNGQVLLMPDSAWVSIHSVGPRVLQMLGLATAPADGAPDDEWRPYRQAAFDAARELAALYKRPVKFVHDLPEANAPGVIDTLSWGGGLDLDSLVTMLPQPDGTLRALVGDVRLGERLLSEAPDAEIADLAATYGLAPAGPDGWRRLLLAAQQTPGAIGLARYLDQSAAHIRRDVAGVERVPLFLVPVASLAGADHLEHGYFLITWNNVVLETVDGARRAEGFASGLATGDRQAAAAFTRAGYTLDYLPVLAESVILNGGYRCASQHVRGF